MEIIVKTSLGIFFFCVLMVFPLSLFGAAFLIYNQDARANGMGFAAISSINNPSAVFYNPAMLVYGKGFGASIGDTIIIPDTSYEDPQSGVKTHAKSKTHHLPNLFVKYTHPNLSFGIGVFSPFGLSTEWPQGWPGRYENTFAEIRTTFVNPSMAFKINDYVSFGVGVSYVKSTVEFKNAINLSALGLPDGLAKLKGEGDGFGYNAGATFRLPREYTLSFTYRSPVEIGYDGKARFYLPSPLASSYTGAYTRLTLPFIAAAGIAKTIGPLVIEADILYTGWSSMSSYRVSSDNGQANRFVYKNWSNTPSFMIGANYLVNRSIELRCGYMYDKSPVTNSTIGPELPDSTRNILTFGGTYRKGGFAIDMGYQATFFEKTDSLTSISGPRGRYNNFAHLILFGVTYTQ
ncbi:MAG: hypothetical protein C0392_10520 [Syntrophus sp. (in: bacteria)]|nr:hypothetical protein [Syntrophus sp. (in: bacteria)]